MTIRLDAPLYAIVGPDGTVLGDGLVTCIHSHPPDAYEVAHAARVCEVEPRVARVRLVEDADPQAGAADKTEIGRLRDLIDRDRTGLAAALADAARRVDSHSWLCRDEEWGSYDYTDRTVETLRREIRDCLDGIHRTATAALSLSGRRAFAAFHPDAHFEEPHAPPADPWTYVTADPASLPPAGKVVIDPADLTMPKRWSGTEWERYSPDDGCWYPTGKAWEPKHYMLPPPAPAAPPGTAGGGERC